MFLIGRAAALILAIFGLCGLASLPRAADPKPTGKVSDKITVKATDTRVASKFTVQKGDWVELEVSGKWRMWDQWDYTGPAGHTNFKKINALGQLGALVCQIGDGKPFTLADAFPFQAASSGEVQLWPNRSGWAHLPADGQLTVVIRTGDHLADKRQKAERALKAATDKLLADPEVRKSLALVNEARKACGLDEVSLSVEQSIGCGKHSKYLIVNKGNPLVAGLKAHEEQPSLKEYSVEGARAGKASVIHFVPPSRAIADWMGGFYHRVPLLQPGLKEIGIGYYNSGADWACAIMCSAAEGEKTARDVVFYPDDQQKNVPLSLGLEIPSPLPAGHSGTAGFPVTVTFAARQKVKDVTMTLTDAAGTAVPAYVSTPEAPATNWPQWNTICLIPKQKLQPGKTYRVQLKCDVAGQPLERSWRFTTTGAK